VSPYPHLAPVDDEENAYTVMVDNVPLVTCEDKSSAVTALFATYWIFDLQYVAAHKKTMELFEKVIFKISQTKPGQGLQRFLNSL